MRARLSLKARGLQYLTQREHSRLELGRKLLKWVQAQDAAAASAAAASRSGSAGTGLLASELAQDPLDTSPPSSAQERVEAALDWLQAHRYLSDDRFAESRIHARSGRYGNLRIRHELKQLGVTLQADDAQALNDSELTRAREVWARKFGHLPADVAERGRQMRFLAGRGFSAEVIRRVVQGPTCEQADG